MEWNGMDQGVVIPHLIDAILRFPPTVLHTSNQKTLIVELDIVITNLIHISSIQQITPVKTYLQNYPSNSCLSNVNGQRKTKPLQEFITK